MFFKFYFLVILVIFSLHFVHCRPEVDGSAICDLPEDKGRCRALIPRWRFDTNSGKCKKFNFGGCGGNSNNFESKEECTKACGGH